MEQVYDKLSDVLTAFCDARGLKSKCAAELLAETDNAEDKNFLDNYLKLWEAVDKY